LAFTLQSHKSKRAALLVKKEAAQKKQLFLTQHGTGG